MGARSGDDRVVGCTGVISDEFWAVVESVLPTAGGERGSGWRDHREVLEVIAWRLRTGSLWRDLSDDLDVPWQMAWKRHRRWSFDGAYAEIFVAIWCEHGIDTADLDEGVQKLLSVDSTSVRVHQHAAGARCDTVSGGAESNDKDLPAESTDHALGRSRGGLTTKMHALTDQATCPVTVLLPPGQTRDNPQLVLLLDAHDAARTADGTGKDTFRLLADKAYSHPSTRQRLRARRILHTIPERTDQEKRRKAKGSVGGRPPSFDPKIYAERNTVERGFGRLKQ